MGQSYKSAREIQWTNTGTQSWGWPHSLPASSRSCYFVFGVTLFLAATSPDGVDEEAAATIILGGTMLACVGALVVAFGLGIAGLWQTERKKLFALLGIVLSGLGLMANFLFLLAGLAMS